MIRYKILETPLGPLRLVSNGEALTRIEFPGQHDTDGEAGNDEVLELCERQLREYFAGERQEFDLPLAAGGTQFQQQVWSALQAIPFGERRSYRDIAEGIGNAKAVRAVGAANGKNPIPIVVPCHRVVGSDGSLTGFAGGLEAKRMLLELESAQLGMEME
jgi:methylated-DNA-[protein]-cysteine S-methyltransferase